MEDWTRPVNQYPVTIPTSPTSSTTTALPIDIHVPTLRADNLHFQTWGSARILANQLHTIPLPADTFDPTPNNDSNGISILELGAGTGLAGLAAALLWRTSVVLTDLAPFVPGLARNIDANRELLRERGAVARSAALDWNEAGEMVVTGEEEGGDRVLRREREEDKASVIVVADCLYSEEHPRMLRDVIVGWLRKGPGARVVVCYPLRVAYLDIIRELWALLEEGGLESVGEGKEEIRDDVWDDERLHEWGVWRWREGSG